MTTFEGAAPENDYRQLALLILLGPVAIRWVVKVVHWPIRSLLLNSFAVSGLPEYYQHLWVGDGQMCLNRKVRLVSLFFLRFQLHNRIPLTSFMTRAAWYLSFSSSFILSPELPCWSVDRLTLTKSFLTFSPLTRIWVLGKHKRLWNLIQDACSTSMQCPAYTGRWTWLLKSTMPCKKCAAAQPAQCCISRFYDTMQVCILPLLELIQHSCTSYCCCRISLVVACVNGERPPSGGWRGLSCGNNILMRIHLFLLSATVWINFYFEYIQTVSSTTSQLS